MRPEDLTQPHALLFCREERFEETLQIFRGDAVTAIRIRHFGSRREREASP